MNGVLRSLCASLVLAIAACSAHRPDYEAHVLRFADAGDISTLNPHIGQSLYGMHLAELTMAWLIKWDAHNQPYAELATEVPTQANGGVSKDGLTITYHLRRGVKWSDGALFDADDVVWSTKAVLNPANEEVTRQGWDLIAKIDEPDKYTVVFHLRKPYSPFVETFFASGANPCILPKHLLARYRTINDVPYNAKPVGIGPFKVERWDRGQQVVLVANPLYFRGRPKLYRIVYKIVPDRNMVLSELEAHEIDMWDLLPGAYVVRARAVRGYEMLRRPSYIFDHLDMNVTHPGLNDPIVRRALRLAWNRRARWQKITDGIGKLSESPTSESAPYAVNVPIVPYDPAQANHMLDADGWKRGIDGVRSKNGVRLSFEYAAVAGMPDLDDALEMMRADWEKIGVELRVKHYPAALMFAPADYGGVVYGNRWDIVSLAWRNEAIGDYSPLYGCDVFSPNGQNDVRWCNRNADAAMRELYATYDQKQRNLLVKAVVRAFVNDAPVIVQDLREDDYAVNAHLKGFNPNAVAPFDNFMNVDI